MSYTIVSQAAKVLGGVSYTNLIIDVTDSGITLRSAKLLSPEDLTNRTVTSHADELASVVTNTRIAGLAEKMGQ